MFMKPELGIYVDVWHAVGHTHHLKLANGKYIQSLAVFVFPLKIDVCVSSLDFHESLVCNC